MRAILLRPRTRSSTKAAERAKAIRTLRSAGCDLLFVALSGAQSPGVWRTTAVSAAAGPSDNSTCNGEVSRTDAASVGLQLSTLHELCRNSLQPELRNPGYYSRGDHSWRSSFQIKRTDSCAGLVHCDAGARARGASSI